MQIAPVELEEVFRGLQEMMVPLLRDRPVRFECQRSASAQVVLADRKRLKQILTNLLVNAARFTDKGVIRLEARSASMGSIAISVADTGVGINRTEQVHIFEPFWQATDVAPARETNHSRGLGLAIAQRLTLAMQGTLRVDSTPGKGSVFTLVLPGP